MLRANPVLADLRQRLLAMRAKDFSAHGLSFFQLKTRTVFHAAVMV
jgi:hypothetical protein